MDYENCVQAFFCESKRLAEEPLPREFTGPDGRRYALVPAGEVDVPDRYQEFGYCVEGDGNGDK